MKYDYLVVGSGLYGAVFAKEATDRGKKVLVIDKRPNVAGNIYTETVEGIHVHKYGAHIFHTNDTKVWKYITRFAEFNRFTNSPVANYHGELYSLPFNMYTFNKMWGVVTPEEAAAKIEEQRQTAGITEPKNLEEQAISLVGKDIFEKLVKGYTEKQWGRDCKDLPAFIIKRLPVRLTFDNNYFNALYQGIPIGGYTKLVEHLLEGIEVRLNTDYLEQKEELDKLAETVVYTGPIDAYFGYSLGALEYRSVRFETEVLDIPNITRFAEFNRFTNSPVANYHGELYSLPFNMYTFNKMWGVVTPEEAAAKIEEQRQTAGITEPKNLEEQAISLVGKDIFEKLVKGYTEKQWGRDCKDLPAFIIKRLPVRLTFDNNYFNALYQGIPIGGYTKLVEHLLEGIEVRLNTDYLEQKEELDKLAETVVYTGPIDAYFGYSLGALEYRSVRFETEVLDIPNFQGNAAVNYTDRETPWTRIIEHKWFEFGKDKQGQDLPKTVISREYSSEWKPGDEPYYPVNDEKNGALYAEYKRLADTEKNVIFGGRLAEYRYYDMDAVIASALKKSEEVL